MTDPLFHARMVAMAAMWAAAVAFGRALGDAVPEFTLAFLRFAFATTFLTAFAMHRKTALVLTGRRVAGILLLAAIGVFGYNAFFFFGLQSVSATRGSLIITTSPAVTALIAALWFREHLRPTQIAGFLLCMLGAVAVIAEGDLSALLHAEVGAGEIALLGAVCCWICYTLLGKKMLGYFDPLTAIWLSSAAGTVMLAFPAFLAEDLLHNLAALDREVWIGAAFMGVFSSGFAFVWYYSGIKQIGAARATNYIYLVPLFAVALGILLLGERPGLPVFAGGAAILGGVWLVQRKPAAATPPA